MGALCSRFGGGVDVAESRTINGEDSVYLKGRLYIGGKKFYQYILISKNSEYLFVISITAEDNQPREHYRDIDGIISSINIEAPSFWLSSAGAFLRILLLVGLTLVSVICLIYSFRTAPPKKEETFRPYTPL